MAQKNLRNDNQIMWRQAFDAYDVSKNGAICVKECIQLCQSLGVPISKQRLHSVVDTVEVNVEGSITWDEFLKLAKRLFAERLKVWMNAFRKFDADHNGFITNNELKTAMKNLKAVEMSDEAVIAFIDEVDEDSDGQINYKEFMQSALGCSAEEADLFDSHVFDTKM